MLLKRQARVAPNIFQFTVADIKMYRRAIVMLQEQLSPYFVCSCGYTYVETGKSCPYYFFICSCGYRYIIMGKSCLYYLLAGWLGWAMMLGSFQNRGGGGGGGA